MAYSNEIIVLLLMSGVAVFLIAFQQYIRVLPNRAIIQCAFFALFIASFATLIEDFIWPQFFNFIEHLGYALNGVLMFVWCWKILHVGEKI